MLRNTDSLSGVPGRGEALEAARALSSQRDHVVACATRDKNRLRAVLLESCPALEAAVDLSDRRWLELLAGFGGAWGIARSGAGGPRAEAAGEAAAASTAPPPALVEAENRQVRFLAARISEALDEAGALEAETAGLLEGDDVSVNIFFTIFTNVFSPIAPTRMRRIRQRGCAAFGV